MTTVRLALVAALFCVAGCLQPGDVPGEPGDPGDQIDAGAGGAIDAGDPPQPGDPDANEGGGDVTFSANVYSIFQSGDKGCANCHGAGGVASFLPMNDGEQAVYDRFMGDATIVNVDNPADSKILKKPLAGNNVSHAGGKLYPSADDPDYQTILDWITAGAPF